MKKTILLLAFILGLISSANAQKFSIKLSVPSSVFQSGSYPTRYDTRYSDNRNSISVGGSIEFSNKDGVKFKINNTQENTNLYSQPLSRKQLEKEKQVLSEIKEK
jgi:Skp family chaperone for outer membrane proteins